MIWGVSSKLFSVILFFDVFLSKPTANYSFLIEQISQPSRIQLSLPLSCSLSFLFLLFVRVCGTNWAWNATHHCTTQIHYTSNNKRRAYTKKPKTKKSLSKPLKTKIDTETYSWKKKQPTYRAWETKKDKILLRKWRSGIQNWLEDPRRR